MSAIVIASSNRFRALPRCSFMVSDKICVIKEFEESGKHLSLVAHDNGITKSQLHDWKSKKTSYCSNLRSCLLFAAFLAEVVTPKFLPMSKKDLCLLWKRKGMIVSPWHPGWLRLNGGVLKQEMPAAEASTPLVPYLITQSVSGFIASWIGMTSSSVVRRTMPNELVLTHRLWLTGRNTWPCCARCTICWR